ncbi:MAG: peptidylprolyl isomerase [Flavobacteriales bacterium]
MKVLITLFLTSILIFSCANEKQEIVVENFKEVPEKIIVEEVDSIELEIARIARTIITNRNAKERLLKFADTVKLNRIVVYTKYGKMKFKLYANTPMHRANFVLLSNKKVFDNTLFYRIIDEFMIQGGNSESETIRTKLNAVGNYRIPNEISSKNIHKKGALVMAVPTEEQDFEKKSSQINFYIVEGKVLPKSYFNIKRSDKKKFNSKQISTYTTKGGAPHLDGDYTVFGEMTSGFGVLSKISRIKVDKYKWPLRDVVIDSIRAF